jgi:hypothetical protein
MASMQRPRARGCSRPDDDFLPKYPNVAVILLVGADSALLEGLTQALESAGHHVMTAATLAEASFVAASAPPMLAVVDRALLATLGDTRALGLAPGGALVAYGDLGTPLPAPIRRSVLAELRLPLERSRLSALAVHVEARAQRVGRDASVVTPPDSRPVV